MDVSTNKNLIIPEDQKGEIWKKEKNVHSETPNGNAIKITYHILCELCHRS